MPSATSGVTFRVISALRAKPSTTSPRPKARLSSAAVQASRPAGSAGLSSAVW